MTIQIAFRSGMSRAKDFQGAVDARVPVGVVATEITTPMRFLGIPKYLASGGAVFIDSGAFTAFKTGVPPDFNRVLTTYEIIAEMAEGDADLSKLYVVSPDAVGNQVETLRLIEQYRPRLLALVDMGVSLIVPIQCGSMPAAVMLSRVRGILNTDQFVAGIPSCAAAMSVEEVATLQHRAFHILGRVQMDETQTARIEALQQNNPGVLLTADANWLRSRMAIVCQQTDTIHDERTAAMLPWQERFRMNAARTDAVAAAIISDQTWASPPAPETPDWDDEEPVESMSP